jgi:hypothetical protein
MCMDAILATGFIYVIHVCFLACTSGFEDQNFILYMSNTMVILYSP